MTEAHTPTAAELEDLFREDAAQVRVDRLMPHWSELVADAVAEDFEDETGEQGL